MRRRIAEARLRAKVELAFKNLTAVSMAAGCSMDDAVEETTFHTGPEAQFETFLAVGDRLLGEPRYPNITCVGVTWLAGFDFEIKAVARIPSPVRSRRRTLMPPMPAASVMTLEVK